MDFVAQVFHKVCIEQDDGTATSALCSIYCDVHSIEFGLNSKVLTFQQFSLVDKKFPATLQSAYQSMRSVFETAHCAYTCAAGYACFIETDPHRAKGRTNPVVFKDFTSRAERPLSLCILVGEASLHKDVAVTITRRSASNKRSMTLVMSVGDSCLFRGT